MTGLHKLTAVSQKYSRPKSYSDVKTTTLFLHIFYEVYEESEGHDPVSIDISLYHHV